jgi:methionyl-tRNA formyltransferase
LNKKLRIVFLGTPDFAAASLRKLIENDINVVAVVTAPDKPKGRGKKLSESAVKAYVLSQNLVFQEKQCEAFYSMRERN